MRMKKKQILILLSSFLIGLSGCEKADISPNTPSPSSTPSVTETTPSASNTPAPSVTSTPPSTEPTQIEPLPPSPAPKEETPALPTEEKIMGSFTTKIMDHGKARMTNLTLAAKAINGTIVKSGEEFSFNEIVGERTKERGYQKAITYVNGERKKDYGGGICQISTTSYNAALNAKMNVTERHEHRVEVPYIEKGKDATVDYENLDFKFKNPFDYSVTIAVSISKSEVSATISK